MSDQGLTFDSEWFSKIAEFEKEFSSSNPGMNPRDPKFADKRKNWAESARREVRRSVYQDTLRDLLESGIPGVSEMKDAKPSVDDDFSGTLAVDPDSDLHEFATLRQNQYESGNPMIYWDDYQKNKPTKAKAALNDFFINAVLAFEGAAESVGKYVGGVAGDMLYPQYSFAEQLGVSRSRLEHIVKTMEGGPSLAIGYDRIKELTDEDKAIYARYLEMRQPLIEGIRSGEGQAYRGFARSLTNKLMTDDVEFYRDVVVGSDPNKPKDIREGIGRAGGGALVNAAGMTGSAIGIIPYSIPAMATRNTTAALALTSPFYAMGHTDAWDRRMRIYEEQSAEAAALGLPAPARPGFGTLNRQAQIAGGTELASEFVFDRLQLALPHVGRWASRRFPRMLKPANRVADAGSELIESFSRKRGLLGAAKGAGLVAAGGVIEGVEELIPPLGQELFIDPFFIPEGYENDFFSPHTAEALGTGFIAGTIMQGGRAGIDPITPSGIARRRARRRVRRAAEGSTAMVAGAIVDKAGRIARARFSANAVAARGSTMAMHQVEQMGSGDRIAMFVSPENVDATLTPAVRERMAAVQITDKPIGRVDGFDVYAPVAFVNEVQEYIGSGEAGKITGNAELMEPDLPMLGAIVIRNKAGQIVDVVPYTDSKAADDALPMISHKAMLSGTTAEKVEGDSLSAISESIELQVDGDATMAGLTPPSKRPISTERKQRGIAALRLEALDEAKPGQNPDDPFQSSMLTQDEIGGAKNSDVEVDVEFREVDPETLSDEERRIGKAIGVNPVVLDGKVVFRIKRPDGTTDVIEKDTIGRGSYLSQVGPDGIFLIRDRNGVMNARTAFVVAMHELRHRFVGKSKTAAEYLSRLLYLDPEFALRGGAQYMQDYVRAFPNNRDVQQDRAILDMDEATVIAYYAGLHGAALSVLADDAGYRDAVRAMRDPNATEEQRSVAQARIAEQQQAEADLGRVERFAEESLANVAENALGITAQKAIEWETFYKDAAGMSHKKFVAWLSHVLAKNGFAGPEARQAVYEVSQRMSGMQDEQMRVHRKLREEVETKAREDMRKYLEMKAGMVPSEKPASEPAAAASEPPVPTPAQQPSQMSLRSQVAAPGKGVAAGDYDKEPDELRAAREQLDAIKDLPSEQRAGALAKVIGSLAEVVPLLTNLQANVGGTSRAGQQQMRFPQGVPERTPETVSPEPMSAGETMSPEMISPGARSMIESQRRFGGAMAALRKQPRAMAKPEFFSALSREVEGIDATAMSGSAWAQRVKGLVAQGKVKQAEVDWTGLEDWLALPRTEKVTKQEVVDFMGRSGIQVVTNRVGENVYDQLDRGIEDGVFNARQAVDDLDGLTADIESAIDQYGTLAQAALANGESIPHGSGIPAGIRPALAQVEEITGMSIQDWISDAQENADYEEQKYESYTLPLGSNYRETLLRLPPGSKGAPRSSYMDPHFDSENVVAHIRTTDRPGVTDQEVIEWLDLASIEKVSGSRKTEEWLITYNSPDGEFYTIGDKNGDSFPSREAAENELARRKEMRKAEPTKRKKKVNSGRVLFVEELQSDWAQMGRKMGFGRKTFTANDLILDRVIPSSEFVDEQESRYLFKFTDGRSAGFVDAKMADEAREKMLEKVNDETFQRSANIQGLPKAPFVENTDGWLNLALKRVIMDAVEGGYDRVAFVNGEQSADRYDLSKRIRSIMHRRTPDGGYDISAISNEGNVVLEQKNASPSELEGIVGKEVTEKIVAGDGRVDEEFERSVFPIRTVMYRRNADGTFDFDAIDVEGVGRISKTRAPLSDVERLLSKRMAELMASGAVATSPEYGRPPRYSDDFKQISEELPSITLGEKREPFKALEGVDLKVGGEGMKAFYDKIVPAAANKLLKKLGGDKMISIETNTGEPQLGFMITPELRQRVMDAGGTPMFSLRRSVRENWKATSKAIDEDGELTTVYNGSPIGFMEFDSQRMGRTDRPVSIGAATSSTTADGMWFTDNKSFASETAGTSTVNMLPKVARILNAKTKALANRLPGKALRKFENAAGIPLQDYVVSPESLAEFMDNDGVNYEAVVRGHVQYLSEMFGNDPAAVSKVDQEFRGGDVAVTAAEQAGSRGGVMRSAHLLLENPLVVPFQTGEPRQTDAGLERDDEPFLTQAANAISAMRSFGHDGLIMEMPDGERRYFVRNPRQVEELGFARDVRESSLLALRKSDVGHKREKATGRYVGAPDWVGGNPRKLVELRKKLRALALEGAPGRYWYENSSRAILAIAGGNVEEAERIVSLIALYSPNATVPANTSMALTAYFQWKAGLPINAGFTVADKKAELLLRKNEPWSGIKTNSFYQNLMVAINPSKLDEGVATMDMWMAIAFDYGDKALDQGPKYKFSEREIQRLAKELGWKAHQVQAAIWTAMKGRVDPIRPALREREIAEGIGSVEIKTDNNTGKQVEVYKINKGREYDHFRLAHEMGMAHPLTQEDIEASKYDFSDALNERMVQLSWEATPSTKTGRSLPGIHTAPIDQKFEYLKAIKEVLVEDGRDLISDMAGLPQGTAVDGFSAWLGDIGAGAQQFFPVALGGAGKARAIKGAAKRLVDLAAAIRGYVLEQDAVVYHTPVWDDAKIRHNGIQLTTTRPLSRQEMQDLYAALHAKFQTWDLAPGYRPDGVRILNFTSISNKDFHNGVQEVIESLPDNFGGGTIRAKTFRSEGDYIGNDWEGNPNGEDYLGRIQSERPDLLQRVRDLRARVEAVNREFDAKYGWGPTEVISGRQVAPGDPESAPRSAMMSMRRGLPGVKDEAVLRYIDKYDELRRLVDVASERGTNLPAVLNPYIGARVLSGVLGAALGRYERSYARLLRRMHVAGVSLDEMDEFLTAQHARERNEYVATINRAFPDGGSGMMSADADNIIQRARNSGRFATLNGFAEEWRRMLRSSLDQRLANGLITQQTYDNLTSRYKNYVPLRGAPAQINDEDFMDFGEAGGRGLSTTGRGVPAALGRRSVAQGVTSQVGFVTEDTFRRIERNRIGQSFLALVLALGDRNTAEVVRPTRRAIVNGAVRTMHDPTWMTDQRNFGLYVNRPVTVGGHTYEPGDLVVIRINNRRLADAMTQPSLELRSFEHALRHVNNGWRFLTTGMGNPTFAPVNLLRDVLTGTLNNLASRGAIDTMSMLARWPGAFRNVFMDAWRGGEPTGSYRRFIRAGGDQLYWRPNDLELKAVQFDELERRVSRRDPDDRTLARTLFGWYPAFFTAAETATRVAQYDQRIATGSAPSEAALAARDITVDFAKGGLAKPVLNTWYMFLNAGLQGNVNVLRSLARSAALVPSLIAMGFVNAAMARFMGGDDEETNQSNWDNVPAYEKTSNMFFFEPSGSGRHIKVPLPYGYNVFFSLGARMADAVYGRSTASDVLSGALVDALNAFNPMGGSGITSGGVALAGAAVPTMARPAIELLGNEDFTGRPIFREQFGRFPGPDSAAAFDGTPEGYLALSEFMNRATGGDEYESGMVDVSPNTIQYLLGYYLSGAGRNLDRLYKAALSNEEVTANDLPLVRSFVGDASNDTRTLSQEFYGTMEALAPTARRIDVAEDEDAPMERRMAAGAELETAKVAMLGELEPYDKALTEIRKQLRGATPEQREAILEVRRRILKSAIRRRNELTDMGYRVK